MGNSKEDDAFVTRRKFLELAGAATSVVLLGGALHLLEGDKYYPRPPGARKEEEFLSLCQRCDLCREACPWDVIAPVPFSKSFINAGTPVLAGHCRYCGLCTEACPTGALR